MPIFETMESWQKSLPSWLEPFGFSKDDALSLTHSLKKTDCPIRKLLEASKLDESAWLTWVKNHFQIPQLKGNFIANDTQKSLQDRYRGLFPDSVAPIAEWDGVLFLACLVPVPGFQPPQKHQWVLSSLSQIRQLRHEPPTMAEVGAPTDPYSLPEGLVAGVGSEITSSIGEEVQEPTALLNLDEPAILEAPLGIDPDLEKTAALTLDFSSLETSSGSATGGGVLVSSPLPPPLPELQPSPLSLSPPLSPSLPSSPPPQILDQAPVQTSDQPIGLHATPSPPTRIEPPPVELKLEGPPPFPGQAESGAMPPPIPFPSPLRASGSINETQPSMPPAAEADLSKTNLGISSEEIDHILAEMKKTCAQAMLLLFHNDSLKVWRATDDWHQDKSRSDLIDLSSASIFRIVKQTKLPYHGYVVSNPINDSFFQTWNKGKTPQHVTVVPVLYEQNLVGMLLGTASFEQAPKISLDSLQALGLEAGLSLVSQAAA